MINDLWYKNAIIYSLSVGTYMDANGDGIGDFIGLTRRLDYLQGLGITAIWLMPFQVSPGRDDGYDVADYYGVDPRYGTLGDFVEFTHAAEQRTRTGIALQQQHAVGDLARGVALWGSQCAIMQLQLRQCLTAAEDIIPDDEVALAVIRPFRGVRTHSFLLALAPWLSRSVEKGARG